MLEVKEGDTILHLIDKGRLVGYSQVTGPCDSSFVGLEGTDWAGKPCFRFPLGGLQTFDPPFERNQLLNNPRIESELRDVLDRNAGSGRLFYNKKLELNQGSYITEPPLDLLELWNRTYSQLNGKQLFDLEQFDIRMDQVQEKLPLKEAAKELTDMAPLELIRHVTRYVKAKGFLYSETEIANFYLALRAKPFVILAGISGTGKTQLPKLFAQAVGMTKVQVAQVSVRPDWTDGSDLIGYMGLDENFKPRDLTIVVQRAKHDAARPYFFILDEMNLARVEHYFSEFLSVIETRDRDEDGRIFTDSLLRPESVASAGNRTAIADLTWPQNLFLIGTVNMDETTHAFSRKVLDRANAIEMNEVELDWQSPVSDVAPLPGINSTALLTKYIASAELKPEDKAILDDKGVLPFLKRVNSILEKADLHFAYRVRDEVAFYLLMNLRFGLMEHEQAIDYQLMQKVLPRIHGSSQRIQRVLVELVSLMTSIPVGEGDLDLDDLEVKVSGLTEMKYRRSVKKVLFMLRRFEEDRFTSFWL
jgi:energy-coupling factor transporter ATP-binding protein EcfA2